ncbi:reverse transcriptase domain-containing protein, partial [Tanacetum coccineum]
MSSNAKQTQSEGNLHRISKATHPSSELCLDELTHGVTGTIFVMICRNWDVYTIMGRYVSTDFIMSDAKGNAIHSSAKANVAHNFLKLKEGPVYSITNFVVQANKNDYRICRDHVYMIELDGAAFVRKTSVKGDVDGYVTNVGRITQQKSGARTLDFSLANGRLVGLGDALVERITNNLGLYPVVLTVMNVKLYNNKLYMSSGSSSQILDDPQIPALKALRSENSLWPSNAESRLMALGHERDETSHHVVYLVLRFRLELDVSDKTASIVVVMFDEPATKLVKCFVDSLAEADEDVGLAYADDRIASEEVVEEDVGSSNVNTSPDINIKQSKRPATKPTVSTPSKPTEENGKKEDSDEEVTCGMDDGQADGKDSYVLDKRKKKRYIETIDNDSLNMDTPIPSISNILHKSFIICSRTNITRDRKGSRHFQTTPMQVKNEKQLAFTSRHPFNTSELSRSCIKFMYQSGKTVTLLQNFSEYNNMSLQLLKMLFVFERPQTCASTRLPKRATLTFA